MPSRIELIVNSRTTYLVIITLLAFEIVFLMIRNRQLSMTVQSLKNPVTIPMLEPGDHVSGFLAVSMRGDTSSVAFDNSKRSTLMFIFNTTCRFCEGNFPAWDLIAGSCDSTVMRSIGVSLHPLEATSNWSLSHAGSFPVFSVADTSFRTTFKITGVPVTLIVDGQGKVLYVWRGELNADQIATLLDSVLVPSM